MKSMMTNFGWKLLAVGVVVVLAAAGSAYTEVPVFPGIWETFWNGVASIGVVMTLVGAFALAIGYGIPAEA